MPKPGKNESRDAFIKRCIPMVIDEGTAKDGAQAAAICNSLWRREKMTDEQEFISFKLAFEPFAKFEEGTPIRLIPEGTWYRGMRKLEVTAQRLKEMAKNFAAGLPRFRIPINLDHEKNSGKVGTIKNVQYLPNGPKGAGLYATDYEFTPKGLEAIEESGYDAVSAEVVWTVGGRVGGKYQDPETGNEYDNVLVGMALTPTPFFGHGHVALFSAMPGDMVETPFGGAKSFADYAKQLEESEERSRITRLHDIFRSIFDNIWNDPMDDIESKIEGVHRLMDDFKQKVSKGDNYAEDNLAQEETMSEDINVTEELNEEPTGIQLSQEEFDALTSKAKLADEHAAEIARLEKERLAHEAEQREAGLRAIAESYSTLPVEIDEFVEHFKVLDEDAAAWFKAQFAAFDAALEAAGVTEEIGSDEEGESFDLVALAAKILNEEFEGDMSRYDEALLKASAMNPALAEA